MAIASITKMAPRSSVPFAISCFVFRTNHSECRPRRNVAGSNFNSSSNDRGPEAFVRSGSAFGLQQYRHECRAIDCRPPLPPDRSEEHTSELQSLMRISYAVFCLKKKKNNTRQPYTSN